MNPAQPSMFEMAMPFIVVFAVMYFLVIRPQGKKAKEQAQFQTNLKRGDEVVTASGILGVIDGITEQFVSLEIAQGTKIKVLRKQILGLQAQVLSSSPTAIASKSKA